MSGRADAVRRLVVWCPDWPVVAGGVPFDVPGVAVRANRVVACTPAARAEGVAVHQRRRDAQARCPELVVVDDDPDRDARAFEPVVRALDTLTPRLEMVHPGCCAVPTRGPSRYHGGDLALARLAATRVAEVLAEAHGGDPAVQVGVADGLFAATLAARMAVVDGATGAGGTGAEALGAGSWRFEAMRSGGRSLLPRNAETVAVKVIPPGESPAFLAPRPLRVLDRPELVDVLRRLGLRTLGDLAALSAAKLAGRFGAEGLTAQRLAQGLDERPPVTSSLPADLQASTELDPPVERVEAAAFVARGLADDLHRRLAEQGSACTRLLVGAETECGERHERLWRTEGTFTPGAIADRLRWQLDGWLQQGAGSPSGGITRLWLVPDEVVAAGGRQLSFSAASFEDVVTAERAARSLARVQGLVGMDATRVPEWRGGRGPGERVALVPAGTTDLTGPRPAARPEWVSEPWPGAVPRPAPAVVHAEPRTVRLTDDRDQPVGVSGRGELNATPARLEGSAVLAWAGPWPCDERWWDPSGHRRRARLQVVTGDGQARLLVLESGRWLVEATYD